ncbi:hypothetical protein BH11PLA1_BH11PLA1_11720 [soil metagenome]
MLSWVRQLLGSTARDKRALANLPTVDRELVAHLWHSPDGLPRIDWEAANFWIARQPGGREHLERWRRGVMAACLDEARDSLTHDHRRWRSANVEGLAPLAGSIGPDLAAAAERSYTHLRSALKVIRGDAPIPPIALVAIEPQDAYIDFTNSYFGDVGTFATSGGLYLNEGHDAFPLIAIHATGGRHLDAIVVHELTHHALHGAGLPPWVEEGFTQMMEERVAHVRNFKLDRETISRQRECWSRRDIEEFLDGSAFHSLEDDVQELAYHLAQWIVRGELDRRPAEFFRFARACRAQDSAAECEHILGATPRQLVLRVIGLEA